MQAKIKTSTKRTIFSTMCCFGLDIFLDNFVFLLVSFRRNPPGTLNNSLSFALKHGKHAKTIQKKGLQLTMCELEICLRPFHTHRFIAVTTTATAKNFCFVLAISLVTLCTLGRYYFGISTHLEGVAYGFSFVQMKFKLSTCF